LFFGLLELKAQELGLLRARTPLLNPEKFKAQNLKERLNINRAQQNTKAQYGIKAQEVKSLRKF
jgi:hypothetical protein